MAALNVLQTDVKKWLQSALKTENLEDFSVEILGNSEKGDGYVGDILFVHVTETPNHSHSTKDYHLVLKCSKRSKALRETLPVSDIFLNELYVYETVFPHFTKFQLARGITNTFRNVPRFYGKFITDDVEILVFENMKKLHYDLWDRKVPLTRRHLDMVVKAYGQFHAISAAMHDQHPEELQELGNNLIDVFQKFIKVTNFNKMFKSNIQYVADVLKGHLDEEELSKWLKLQDDVDYIMGDMIQEYDGLKVISHGDCWNNNFLFQSKDGSPKVPLNVSILDWQMSRFNSPILDLSYFLFATISSEDLEDLDDILALYYSSFADYVKLLGSDPVGLFSHEQFLKDWKKYSKFGIVMYSVAIKICVNDEESEMPDMVESAESGTEFIDGFNFNVKNVAKFRDRIIGVVKHVLNHKLI